MPSRRSSRRGSFTSHSRRELIWATEDDAFSLVAGAWTNNSMLVALAAENVLGITVIRTHVTISVTTGTAAGTRLIWGQIVGRGTDIGVSIPGSVRGDQAELDWMYVTSSTSAPTFGRDGTNILSLDNHAKRKMGELNQRLVLSIFNTSGITVAGRIYARTLVALP